MLAYARIVKLVLHTCVCTLTNDSFLYPCRG